MAYILKYDSMHGYFDGTVNVQDGMLIVNERKTRMTVKKEPRLINWGTTGVEYVVEGTGRFLTKELSQEHIGADTKYVVISAPSKGDTPMFVTGVSLGKYVHGTQFVFNASYTTSCLVPLVKVFSDNFSVKRGLMTTVYVTTATQKTVDGFSLKDWHGGRSVIGSVVPPSTGAAKVIGRMIPRLNGKPTSMSLHVSTMDVFVVDLTVQLKRGTNYDEIYVAMKKASEVNLKEIVEYCDELLMSQNFVSDPHTSIFGAKAGIALMDTFVKIIARYDNEWGYSNRVFYLVAHIAKVSKQSR